MFHILIVEDNLLFRQVLEATLLAEFPDMTTSKAGSAEEAWRRIEREVPDIAFVDIRLPGQNGLELTKRIKESYPATVVIILTSYDLPESRAVAKRYRCDHFLVKGAATNDEVVGLVRKILTKRHIPADQEEKG